MSDLFENMFLGVMIVLTIIFLVFLCGFIHAGYTSGKLLKDYKVEEVKNADR